MKVLFSSYSFAPNLGGIESVSALLADKFAKAGHEVELITQSPGETTSNARYRITRRPSFGKLLRLVFWCDLLFQNNISLRNLIPALLLNKRVIVVHQTWLRSTTGRLGWNNWIKYFVLSFVTNVAISEAIRDHLGAPARIIWNPYNDQLFRSLDNISRDRTLAFVGRLVSDKGVDLLLKAMKILQADGLRPDLTIIGQGPEEPYLKRLVSELGLEQQVGFAGAKSGEDLVKALNRHRILVVPSRWAEPFGIVALEAIACGCAVVGSSDGGLKEAIGPCGLTFKNGNENALADCLKSLLLDEEKNIRFRKAAPAHLANFRADTIAAVYLELIHKQIA